MKMHTLTTIAGIVFTAFAALALFADDETPPSKSTKAGAAAKAKSSKTKKEAKIGKPAAATERPEKVETATFGSGCFWCSEAVFQRVKGVVSAVPGYSGGTVKNPTYQQVCTKLTGHAEVVQITYDPSVVTFKELLEVFWKSHDPTKLNKQGPDEGPQYRSVIFYHDDEQKAVAEKSKADHNKSMAPRKIVTEISAFKEFYEAEEYHQNYFNNNPDAEYCENIIAPKVKKVERALRDKMNK